MISIQDLTKGFERENLIENLNLVIHPNKRIALVGKNGSGKTTFLRCLVGQESFDGRIISDEINISIMEQEDNFENLDKTFNEYLEGKKKKLEDKKLKLEEEMGNPELYEDETKFNTFMDHYNLLLTDGSFNLENTRLIEILTEIGIDESILNQNISELSGGQKIKLRLAECLSKKADLYLLDEPTNHLDLEVCEWLGKYIKESVKSLIVISHDRYFLNEIVDEVWKIEDKKLKKYPGSYDGYEEKEVEYLKLLRDKFKKATRKKKELLESAKKNRLWASIAGSKSLTTVADRLERDAENIEIGTNPDSLVIDVKIRFTNKKLHNCEVFRLADLAKKFETRELFRDVNQEVQQGEKIAIIGGNGTGKTTLLKMLVGVEGATQGVVERRQNLKIGYFDQELKGIDREQNILEFLEKESDKKYEVLISTLARFGFDKSHITQKIKRLSGGEKGRLNILRISLEDNEILLLDEPTNNLDIHLKDSLEKAVREFPGTVIIVSHDRHFMDKVATRILEIKDKKIQSYKGNYSDYIEAKSEY